MREDKHEYEHEHEGEGEGERNMSDPGKSTAEQVVGL